MLSLKQVCAPIAAIADPDLLEYQVVGSPTEPEIPGLGFPQLSKPPLVIVVCPLALRPKVAERISVGINFIFLLECLNRTAKVAINSHQGPINTTGFFNRVINKVRPPKKLAHCLSCADGADIAIW